MIETKLIQVGLTTPGGIDFGELVELGDEDREAAIELYEEH